MAKSDTEKAKPTALEAPETKVLTLEELSDTSRYQFTPEYLPLPELGGGVMVRPLTVEARLELPSMRDEDGKFSPTLDTMAATFAAFVVEPKMTTEDAMSFIGKLPGTCYDAVQLKVAEMVGSAEEARATRKEFRSPED